MAIHAPCFGAGVEVAFILRQSGARALICSDAWRHIDYLEHIARLDRSELPQLEHVVVIGARAASGTLRWSELEARATSDFELPRPCDDR